jgi:type I restriction enzyme M protein
MHFDRVLTNPPFSINWGNTEKNADGSPAWAPKFPERFPTAGAAGRQEGRPDVPAAHAARHPRRRDGHRHAPRRAVPRRRGARHPRRHHRRRPARSRHRRGAQPVLRHRHPGLHPGAAPAAQNGANRVSGKPPSARARCCSSTPTASSSRAGRRTTCCPSTSRRSSPPSTNSAPSTASRPSSTTPRSRPTTTTSTSAATPTTRRRPSRTTCAPIWWAACPRPRWPPRRAVQRPRPRTRWICWSSATPGISTSPRPRPQTAGLKPAIETTAGLLAKEAAIRAAFEQWWQAHSAPHHRTGRADRPRRRGRPRARLLASFSQALERVGLLDPFQVRGIVAGFWYQNRSTSSPDGPRRQGRGRSAWRTSIVTALEDKASKKARWSTSWSSFLMSDFVEAITELEAKKAELDSQIKAAEAPRMPRAKTAKPPRPRRRPTTKRRGRGPAQGLEEGPRRREEAAQGQEDSFRHAHRRCGRRPDARAAAELLLTILHDDMRAIVERYIAAQRKPSWPRSRTGGTSTG